MRCRLVLIFENKGSVASKIGYFFGAGPRFGYYCAPESRKRLGFFEWVVGNMVTTRREGPGEFHSQDPHVFSRSGWIVGHGHVFRDCFSCLV